MKNSLGTANVLGLLILLSCSVGFAGPALTYQGRILKADGSPVKTSTSFTIAIVNPTGSCVLWSEPFSSSMSGGDGAFSFTIGKGPRSDAGTREFKDIFTDGVVITPNGNCPAGYTKLPSDVLKLSVSFNDGTGPQSLSHMDITAVPFAIEAQKVAGVAGENVVRVSDGAASPLSSADFSELLALLNGTSRQYSKNSQLKGMAVPTLSEGQVLGWSGGTWAPISLAAGGVMSVRADAPLVVDSSLASSPKIVLSKSDSGTNGYLSKEDWSTFNQKQSKTLANGKIWVGDTSNVAAAVSPGGDISMADDGVVSIQKIRNNPVTSGTMSALDIGKVYRWSGTQLVPSFLNFGDLKTASGANQLVAACAANQKIQWSVITDAFTCEAIGSLDASVITGGVLDTGRLPANATRWQDGSSGTVYYNGGNVGIGTASPDAKLQVSGQVLTPSINAGAPVSSALTIDWGASNTQYTSGDCGGASAVTYTMNNMLEGGVYSLVMTGTAGGTCTFVAGTGMGGVLFKFPSFGNAVASGKMAVFTFMRANNYVFITWMEY